MISKKFQSFSRSLEQFILTVGQNNFGNKIPFLGSRLLEKKILQVFFWLHKKEVGKMLSSLKKLIYADFSGFLVT